MIVIVLPQDEAEAGDRGPVPLGGLAVLVPGRRDGHGLAPPGLFHAHQGMMTTAEEVTLQTSEDVPGPDHRQMQIKMKAVVSSECVEFIT